MAPSSRPEVPHLIRLPPLLAQRLLQHQEQEKRAQEQQLWERRDGNPGWSEAPVREQQDISNRIMSGQKEIRTIASESPLANRNFAAIHLLATGYMSASQQARHRIVQSPSRQEAVRPVETPMAPLSHPEVPLPVILPPVLAQRLLQYQEQERREVEGRVWKGKELVEQMEKERRGKIKKEQLMRMERESVARVLTGIGKERNAYSPTPPLAKRARGTAALPMAAHSLLPAVNKKIDSEKIDSDDSLPQAMEIYIEGDALVDHQRRVKLIIERLTRVFRDVQLYRELLRHRDAEAQMILDGFQMLLDMPSLLPEFKSNLLVATQRLSKSAGLYPASYNLQNIILESDNPVAAGSFADIYKGRFQGKVVCLKVIRLYQTSHAEAFLKQFCTEAILWSQLSHPNLLPVYGLYRYSGRVCLVSPWMEYGDVTAFLSQHPNECRTLLVIDVASGINYLHTQDIIHGDLKGVNILVDSSRRACLADFGLSGVSEANILHWTSHSSAASKGGSVRWQAPELFDFESETTVHNSKPSDVYAFACVAYEIYTGTVPFAEITRDPTVMFKVQSGSRPSKPDASSRVWEPRRLTEGIWSLMKACWAEDPGARPSIKEAYDVLVEGTAVEDDWPSANVDIMSPGHLRDSVDAHGELSASIETVLDRLGLS